MSNKVDNSFCVIHSTGIALAWLLILSILYLISGFITIIETYHHYLFFRNIESFTQTTRIIRGFRVAILFMSSWIMFQRGLITLFGVSTSDTFLQFFINYSIPFFLQFCCYILLTWLLGIIRFSTLLNQKTLRWCVNPTFIILIVSSFILVSIASLFASAESVQFVLSACIYSVIVVFLGTSSFFFYRVLRRLSLTHKNQNKIRTFMYLIIFNSVLFVIRAIYDFTNLATHKIIDWTMKNDTNFYTFYFFWMLLFEIIPNLVLVIAFHINISTERDQSEVGGSLWTISALENYEQINDSDDSEMDD
ncbi:hypothetical protein M0811_14597 [Anaeramoeba ignava]|uniref:Uncharacterized protein n=1 Tax=Anaeramoeba ignava TaxID=1746090 RepID=A0A9Q0RFN8_ANAIG|nr:hypothetical protein M0811_14597 [Anaeramoeba ignava]